MWTSFTQISLTADQSKLQILTKKTTNTEKPREFQVLYLTL